MLWANLMEVVDRLAQVGLKCDIWLDGSFLTEKIDPDDVDFVVDVPAGQYDKLTFAQESILSDLSARKFKEDKHLHSFVMFNAPMGHSLFPLSRESHERWKRDFGFAYVSRIPKGIAVIGVEP